MIETAIERSGPRPRARASLVIPVTRAQYGEASLPEPAACRELPTGHSHSAVFICGPRLDAIARAVHDITMVSPSFLNGELVGFFACTAHVVDVGGRGFGADGKSVYEEGLQIPIMKFAEKGKVNLDLVKILRCNVREPNQVVGDFYSLAACNDVGHRRLLNMMKEVSLTSLDELGEFIFSRTRDAMLERIRSLPKGSWSNELITDGYEEPVKLVATISVRDDHVDADFTGTDPVSRWGINVPIIYSKAYACYALKCVVAPDIPNNAASLAFFIVTCPRGADPAAVRAAGTAVPTAHPLSCHRREGEPQPRQGQFVPGRAGDAPAGWRHRRQPQRAEGPWARGCLRRHARHLRCGRAAAGGTRPLRTRARQ